MLGYFKGVLVSTGSQIARNGKTYGNVSLEQDGRVYSIGVRDLTVLNGLEKYKLYNIAVDAFLYQGKWILSAVEFIRLD